jgi:hypothetical protein
MFKEQISMEMIQFQTNNKLGPEIENLIRIARSSQGERALLDFSSRFTDTLQRHTGLLAGVDITNSENVYDISAHMPILDKNNPLFLGIKRWFMKAKTTEKLLNKRGLLRGEVDLRRARVSGVFSEIKNKLEIPKSALMGNKLSIKELTAAILHEIGHMFTMLEVLGRTVTTNYVLTEGVKRFTGTTDEKIKFELMDQMEQAADLKIKDREALMRAKSDEEVVLVLYVDEMETRRAELGFDNYDYRGAEQLADQFAVRMGYGEHLVSVLGKSNRDYREYIRTRRLITFKGFMLHLLGFLFIPSYFNLLLFYWMFEAEGEVQEERKPTYDTEKRRAEVIANDMRLRLKNQNLPDWEKKQLLDQLDQIETTTEEMIERKKSFFARYQLFFQKHIFRLRLYKEIDRQKLLEDFAASRLLESREKLKLMERTV